MGMGEVGIRAKPFFVLSSFVDEFFGIFIRAFGIEYSRGKVLLQIFMIWFEK
jgi:hypothetical protein